MFIYDDGNGLLIMDFFFCDRFVLIVVKRI